jgi:hypothetical protein
MHIVAGLLELQWAHNKAHNTEHKETKSEECSVGLVRTNVLEECVTSIFRVEKFTSEHKRQQLAISLLVRVFENRVL